MTIESSSARSLLMICYAFPPVGGAGVQRSVKFVKYLRRFGWQPTILTVHNPSVPVMDTDLGQDVPVGTAILKARTFEPGYRVKRKLIQTWSTHASSSALTGWKPFIRGIITSWLQPDPQILWNRFALQTAIHSIQQNRYSAIYVTGPPFSSFLLGCTLKRKFGLPLILDFRDEWSLSARYLENQGQTDRILRRQMKSFESTIVQADAIIATTQASANELKQCSQRIGGSAIVRCIYNGYDPDDFSHLTRNQPADGVFRLVYTGTLWRLTDIVPLVNAVMKLAVNYPIHAKKLELHFVGRRTPDQELALQPLIASLVRVRMYDYLPHLESLQLAKNADGLLVTLADEPGAERVIPGKLFEYLAMRLPILGIVPHGETREIMSQNSLSTAIDPGDIEAIEAWLISAITSKFPSSQFDGLQRPLLFANSGKGSRTDHDLQWCSRIQLTEQLASLLSQTIEQHRLRLPAASNS